MLHLAYIHVFFYIFRFYACSQIYRLARDASNTKVVKIASDFFLFFVMAKPNRPKKYRNTKKQLNTQKNTELLRSNLFITIKDYPGLGNNIWTGNEVPIYCHIF